MGKRTRNADWLDDSDGEAHELISRKMVRPTKQPPLPLPKYKAIVTHLSETASTHLIFPRAHGEVSRQKMTYKCFDKTSGNGTGEREKKAVRDLPTRLASPASSQTGKHAGYSVVCIARTDGDYSKVVKFQNFVNFLLEALQLVFDCKSYSESFSSRLDLVFYGISENSIAAALAFETAYNQIWDGARRRRSDGSQNSYSIGFADKLYRLAKRERAEEENEAQDAEAKPNLRSADQSLVIEDNESKDDESEDEDGKALNDAEHLEKRFRGHYLRSPASLKKPSRYRTSGCDAPNLAPTRKWLSHQQLMTFRATASKIADDYLEEQNKKPRKRYLYQSTIRDQTAYSEGKNDAKKHRLQRRLPM